MKSFSKLLVTLLLIATFFAGCKTYVTSLPEKGSNKVHVTLNISGSHYAARTALPGTINFADYTYTLKAENSNDTITLFSNDTYDELNSETISLEAGIYTFTLEAYKDSINVLTGIQENINISGNSSELSFIMYQNNNLDASVNVILYLPTYETIDGKTESLVSTVKAGVASSPVAGINDCNILAAEVLAINNLGTNNPYVIFANDSLKTGVRQYILFYLFDKNDNLVGSVAEGVVLCYGKTSTSVIAKNRYTLGTYPVEIRLNKDGEVWSKARKVKLINKSDPSKEFELKTTPSGSIENPIVTFIGNVPNSAYYVAVQTNVSNNYRNTFISFDTAQNSTQALDFYTVTLEPGTGVKLESVTDVIPQPDDGSILFLKGDNYTYKVALKEGYDPDSVIAVKENDEIISIALNTERSISIQNKTVISTTVAAPVEYTITYKISERTLGDAVITPEWSVNNSDATVLSNTPAVFKKYVVTKDFNLPAAADLTCTGQLLDGWYKEGDSSENAFALIKADTLHENLTLLPKWKEASAEIVEPSKDEDSEEETSEGILSSNGISFIICDGGTSDGEIVTNIYYDINANGLIDEEDGKVSVNGITNFTDYEISAAALSDGSNIASNVTFTVTGGRIYSIKGLGSKSENISTLNISGNPVIGGAEIQRKTIGDKEFDFATNLHGVYLNSFTNERVNVTGKVTSAQGSVVLLTDYEYENTVPHYVAVMDNIDYAEAGLFDCYNTTQTAYGYARTNLGKIEVDGKYVIRLTNDSGIGLVDNDQGIILVRDANGEVTGFTLGADRINTQCSVFSISCENGSMQFNQSKMYGGNDPREEGLTYLGQYVNKDYAEELDTENKYVYMHIMASNNQFTEGDASDFLEQVVFKPEKDGDKFKLMSVKVNLETIPFTVIQSRMNSSEITYIDEDKNEATLNGQSNKGFSYFDGSFYLGVQTSNEISWISAYNDAKKLRFNGLTGYLINITSDLENEYIFNKMGLGLTWTGGARYDSEEDHRSDCELNETYHVEYDSPYRTEPGAGYRTDNPNYRWQSGPEAGEIFTTGSFPEIELGGVEGTTYASGEKLYGSISNGYLSTPFDYKFVDKIVNTFDENNNLIGTAHIGSYNWQSWPPSEKDNTFDITIESGSDNIAYFVRQEDCKFELIDVIKGFDIGNGNFENVTIPENQYANWDAGEPNDSNHGQSEECVHFQKSGKWNDYSWDFYGNSDGTPGVQGYIVEFTPYDFVKDGKTYSSGKTDAAPITKILTFDLNK